MRYPIFDLRAWTSRGSELANLEQTVVRLLTVERSWRYAIPAGLEDLVGLLERHRFPFVRRDSSAMGTVERYRVNRNQEADVEDKQTREISVHVLREEPEPDAGTVILPARQAAAKLILLLLEPQWLWSPIDELLEVGTVCSRRKKEVRQR